MYKNGKNITFTDRSNSSVDMFLRDIRKSVPLSSAEELELWYQMRQGSESARDQLIYANLRYVVTIAKKYLFSGTAFEDLLMAGSLGITRAADMFDPGLGYRFITFAKWYIESEVQKAAKNHLKHKRAAVSLDEPLYPDEDYSVTMISRLPSAADDLPDWHIRYDDALQALKWALFRNHWHGIDEMLDDYVTMMAQGLTVSHFARKYRLTDRQMRRFLDMLHTECRRYLSAA